MTNFLNTRILLSGATILAAAVVIVGATLAFFSDVETSEANAFTAGDVQIAIDSLEHSYEGNPGGGEPPFFTDNGFSFALTDLKPLDWGGVSYVLDNQSNDAYVCAMVEEAGNSENVRNNPEQEAGDTTAGNPGNGNGELQNFMSFDFGGDQGLLSDIDGQWFNVGTGPILNGQTGEFEIGYCFGEYDSGDNCIANSSGDVNVAQTDGMTADISFYAVQARNNEEFDCATLNEGEPGEEDEVGAVLSAYVEPAQDECDATVSDDSELQTALGSASSGDTICLEDGEYNEFVVDQPLTIAGLTNPGLGSAKVVPSGSGVTDLILVESSDVTITGLHLDGDGTTFTGNQLAGIRISPDGADIDNVTIEYNVIENLAASGANPSSKGIQYHANGTSFALTNSNFENNVIDNITSTNKGGYGVQTVGALTNLSVAYNTISNTGGVWGAGVAFDGNSPVSTSGISVDHNQIMTGVHNGTSIFAVQVEANADGSGFVINNNNIESLLYGGSSGNPSAAILNAENNWWGTASPTEGTDIFEAPASNEVDFDPAVSSAFTVN